MVVVPAIKPVTTPVVASILATAITDELHVPPVDVLDKVVVPFSHTLRVPVIAAGSGFTVKLAVVLHPSGNV
jgi:hypothetical protein